MKKTCLNINATHGGFSLIEIMISAFILALGLLGLAGMQSTAVKSTIEIQQRSLANSLITDITERMQLNRLWLSGAGNSYSIDSLTDANLSIPNCIGSGGVFVNCSGEDIKNNDLYEWKQKFTGAEVNASTNGENGLVEADACIAVSPASGSDGELVQIVISWFSTVKSKDAAANAGATDLTNTCGTANAHRRQLSVETYISKSS
ncbi:type IV pilus modification protein PilV [Psychromonas sp. psych-6C06]|uniref:type IV pilus modification protein PilV n=1 Tax=Psychromonas sp. psych-6C06 TaxID=2058089 RepID=UPI000C34535F|nr:type IV pilus modification protein PilV [Psychromonas sp. psych-6C06]PKF61221.1 type IV pilus modification protein PilV [Psychromonas sp. psych-6C06]